MPYARRSLPFHAVLRALTPLALLAFASSGWSKVVYVTKNATASVHNGLSWTSAFTTVQEGINAASSGDEVWVAAALYAERITLKSGTRVYGGFTGNESAKGQRNWTQNRTVLQSPDTGTVVIAPTSADRTAIFDGFTVTGVIKATSAGIYCQPSASPTISHNEITGNQLGIRCSSGTTPLISENTIHDNPGHNIYSIQGYPVIAGNIMGPGDNAVYDGGVLTMTGNTFDGSTGYSTGAFVEAGSTANLTRNTFKGWYYGVTARPGAKANLDFNTFLGAGEQGTGMWSRILYAEQATVKFTNNTVTDVGGAIVYTNAGELTATGNTIRHCTTYYDATIYTKGTNATISRNTLAQNHSGTYGAIGCVGGRTVIIRDNAITLNTASTFGGGLAVTGPITTCTIVNNTIVGNLAPHGGNVAISDVAATLANNLVSFGSSGLYISGTEPQVSHNCVYANSAYNYAGIADPTGIDGNISADPLFMDWASGDFHLRRGSPCLDAGDGSFLTAGGADADGQPRVSGAHVDIGAYEWQVPQPWLVSLGSAVSGGVTVAEGIAYVPANDGKLYARSTRNGAAVVGFPVDISAAVGAAVKLPSRPAVYYGKTGKAIYLTTDRGDVVRILPSGQVCWHVRPLNGQTVSTPAVTPDGYVYVNLSTGSGPFSNYVFKLDEATGTPQTLSPFLGYTTADCLGDFSPAASNTYLYINSGWGSGSGLTLLNQGNLAVRSSFAAGEQCLSPVLLGSDLIVATRSGKVFKVNAVTAAPDLGFGHIGVADVGSPITAAPFSDAAGIVYLGTADGRIMRWAPGSGSFQPFYATTGRVAGLTIDRSAGVLGFGTSSNAFVQVPLDNPAGATTVTPGGPISTGVVYEALTDRFIVVTDTGTLCGYPAGR